MSARLQARLWIAQRATAAILAFCVVVHLATIILAIRQVAWLFSWPSSEICRARPPCASTNSADWTKRPPEPQAGSSTRPSNGSSISTSNRVTERGV